MPNVSHPPVYMATLTSAREAGAVEDFTASRELNRACAAAIDKAIQDSNYKAFHYKLEEAAAQVTEEYGMERVKIILANTVQLKNSDGRFSRDNKEWAQGVALPEVPKDSRFDFFTDTHPVLVDGFINKVRQLEHAAEKAAGNRKPSVLGQLHEGKQADVSVALAQCTNKSPEMEV